MQYQTAIFRRGQGWSAALPAHLDSPQTVVFVFGASDLLEQTQPLAELHEAFPTSVVMGCSTSGEIAGAQVLDGCVSIAVVRFEHTRLKFFVTPLLGHTDSFEAGRRAGAALDGPDLRAVFVLAQGLRLNGTALVAGLASSLPRGIPVTGGLAGDGRRFSRTWILGRDGRPLSSGMSALGLYGDRLHVGHGCKGGWSDFGPERRITRAQGNILYELDGKPALDLYTSYLGKLASGLPGTALLFPLAIRRDETETDPRVYAVLGIDPRDQALIFGGDIPQGGIVRLMRANTDKLIHSASLAAEQAVAGLSGQDDIVLISVSCVGRRLALGERTEEEVETVFQTAPGSCAHVGFYSYGEIAPFGAGGVAEMHNETLTVTALAER